MSLINKVLQDLDQYELREAGRQPHSLQAHIRPVEKRSASRWSRYLVSVLAVLSLGLGLFWSGWLLDKVWKRTGLGADAGGQQASQTSAPAPAPAPVVASAAVQDEPPAEPTRVAFAVEPASRDPGRAPEPAPALPASTEPRFTAPAPTPGQPPPAADGRAPGPDPGVAAPAVVAPRYATPSAAPVRAPQAPPVAAVKAPVVPQERQRRVDERADDRALAQPDTSAPAPAWQASAPLEPLLPRSVEPPLSRRPGDYEEALRLLRQQRPAEAEALLRSLIVLEPQHVGARLTLARLLASTRRAPAAADVLSEGLRRVPDHVGLRLELAEVQLSTGQDREALTQFEQALKIPSMSDAQRVRVEARMRQLSAAAR